MKQRVNGGENEREKPKQSYTKTTLLAQVVLEDLSRWDTLPGKHHHALVLSSTPPEAVAAAVP